eukprot:scaffold16533_cov18-Tisochrysis_lutea.AAC.2
MEVIEAVMVAEEQAVQLIQAFAVVEEFGEQGRVHRAYGVLGLVLTLLAPPVGWSTLPLGP